MASHLVRFRSTRWSLIASIDQPGSGGQRALADLCETYWQPLYAFLRSDGQSPADAEDLVQGFLADLLGRGDITTAHPDRGRFRTFLLAALKNYVAKQRDAAAAIKRGGRVTTFAMDFGAAETAYQYEPSSQRTPDAVYDRQWALALLASVLDDLQAEQEAAGKGDWFAALRPTLTTGSRAPYQQIADELGATPGAVKTAASRLRRQYRDALDAALADGLASDADIADERRALFAALR